MATRSATAAPTWPSSTRAASPTKRWRSRARRRPARRARTAACTSRAAARTSPATRSPACPTTSSSSRAAARRRRSSSPATSARSAASRRMPDSIAFAPSSRCRTAARSRAASASSRSSAAPRAAAPPRPCSAEIRRRVAQGHREVVLTGINLGCYRDRAAGYRLARLVREAGATPGLERLRLSSIEINHVDDELVRALRETPTASRHLHVPLQSGDDDVLRAMGRRYSVGTYLRRLEPLRDDFNLTSDVIVGFPTEDERAFENTLRVVARGRTDEGARLPVLAAAGNRHRRRGPGAAAREEGAERAAARGVPRGVPRPLALEDRPRRPRARRSAEAAATATTTPRGSCRSRRPSASCSVSAAARVSEEGILAA